MNCLDRLSRGRFDGCFLSRPRPAQGEFLDAYLHRALRANGHESLRGLIDGRTYSTDIKRLFLTRRLRLSNDELQRLTEPGGFISRTQGDRKLFLTSHIRWCPQCVADNPILLSRWLYRTTVVCTQHRAFMRDECPHCHAPQKIQRFSSKCCSCGSSVSKPVADDVPEPLVQLQARLDEALTVGQTHRLLFNLQYHQAAKLMHYLGVVACSARQGSLRENVSSRRVLNDRVLMSAASGVVTHWPHSFTTLLALKQAVPATNSVRNDFGSLYAVLYRTLKGVEYQFLREAFESYVNSHWAGVLTRRNRFFSEQTRRSHPRTTINKAARLFNTPPALLKRLSTELKGSEIVFKSGRRLRTIESAQLNTIRGVTLTQAVGILHLPERRIRMLIESGLLQPEVSPTAFSSAAWFISEERLQALFVHPTGQTSEGGVSLYRLCRYGRISEAEFVELARALISQGLDIVNASNDPIPLGLAEIRHVDLRRWLLTLRAHKGRSLSVDEAAKALGIKQQVAYQLVHSGLLQSYRGSERTELRVRYVDLEAFQRQYISLAQLARNKKTSPKALLRKILCSPVTGPDIDGGRQYFYRRVDLNEWVFNGGNHDGR
ncbi:helix-turn-helix domain-containing protein [Pusillimonas noertemannii]|uniref:helix-turn-helix domain-containing protein n=1 Tax=Pusillimonas noertemannii TaxID=305977 RepID=UPI00030257F2|nr:helix-turn-helix domain-containing protein [Pusillimonas noertemannii]